MTRTFVITLAVFVGAGAAHAADAGKPYGIDKRTPWTTSRVVGYPDPPLPYRVQRAYPQLKFNRPLYVISEPGSDRILVVEQGGRVAALKVGTTEANAETFCKVADHDFYGMTFHPDYAKNGYVYVFSNGPNSVTRKKNRILRFQVPLGKDGKTRAECDPKSQFLIIEWESNGHNGGDLGFGKDGHLYITSGDGTSDSDGDLTGQDLRDLCSGVLRIDVEKPDSGKGYAVPADNPFLKTEGAKPELWAFGFRNPWRMTFEPRSGDLWVSDVGQDQWEMIHRVERGGNYGWSVYEGSHPFYLQRKRGPGPILPPAIEHAHSESRSITGGVFYAGPQLKGLAGTYVYGDYSTGKIWGARYADGKVTERRDLANSTLQILGFGHDPKGDLLIVDYAGGLYRLEPTPPETVKFDFPRKLSDTGIFTSVPGHKTHPGLIPYSVNAALWSDGAHKERFIGVPGDAQIDFSEKGYWTFPKGTVLVKTFSLDLEAGNPASRRRIETRLLHIHENEWHGYSYVWNEEQTEAILVPAAGLDRDFVINDAKASSGKRKQTWHYPSRVECMVCHTRAASYVLGVTTMQMNKVHDYGTVSDNQLRTLEHIGILRVNLVDYARNLEERGRRVRSFVLDGLLAPARKVLTPRGEELMINSKPVRQAWPPLGANWQVSVRKLENQPRYVNQLPGQSGDFRRLVDPYDATADREARVRSYLHANCAHCHQMAGGGNSAIDLLITTGRGDTRLLDVVPQHDTFGIRDARLVAPGDPARSVLHRRLTLRERGQMPPLASSLVDQQAAALVEEWIKQLKK